jgi:septal ring factor EnvC (AmiA/AmiB activator)
MDFLAEINSVKAKLADLETQLQTATGEERIALQNRITATQNTLTEYVKLLQTTGKNSALKAL